MGLPQLRLLLSSSTYLMLPVLRVQSGDHGAYPMRAAEGFLGLGHDPHLSVVRAGTG